MFDLELIKLALIAYLGLCIGYHVVRAFRDIETQIGQPGFSVWLRGALDRAMHHHDIWIAGIIACICVYQWTTPFTNLNVAIFMVTMSFAAWWDDKHDAPPKELVTAFIHYLKLSSKK